MSQNKLLIMNIRVNAHVTFSFHYKCRQNQLKFTYMKMDVPIAAIDVGSGMTKFVIAVVNRQINRKPYIEVVQQIEKPIPYGVDWKSSSDGYLSQNIQQQGLALFRIISDITNEWKAKNKSKYPHIHVIGVGTEVFRKAKNGKDFLKLVESKTNLKIELISQEKEAYIGFRTGEAALMTLDSKVLKDEFNYKDDLKLAVYDSGGGSFQITWLNQSSKEFNETNFEERLNKILKPNGLAPTLKDLLTLQKKNPDESPNPVSLETAMELVNSLITKYIDVEDIKCLNNKTSDTLFLSIGGINSHVRLATDVIRCLEYEESINGQEKDLENTMDFVIGSKLKSTISHFSFTEESVTNALKRICFKKDSELELFSYYNDAEPVSYMVPKLCILLSVLKGYEISKIHWIMCCGSCYGLILDHCDKLE